MTQDQLRKLTDAIDALAFQQRMANQIAVETARGAFGDDTDKAFAVKALAELAMESRHGAV